MTSEKGCKDIIFRISSVGFDWYPYIQGFVGTTRLDIDTVTIVRDAESTGAGNVAYRALDGKHLYNRMPGREFLDERNSQTAPKNHLHYMEGATNARVRGARASLFEGGFYLLKTSLYHAIENVTEPQNHQRINTRHQDDVIMHIICYTLATR